MFPIEIWITYTLACLLLVISPGPDNILAIGRGMSQGKIAACVSGVSSGAGILFHVITATFGLTLLIQTSATPPSFPETAPIPLLKNIAGDHTIGVGLYAPQTTTRKAAQSQRVQLIASTPH